MVDAGWDPRAIAFALAVAGGHRARSCDQAGPAPVRRPAAAGALAREPRARSRSADSGDGPGDPRHDDERMAGRSADDGRLYVIVRALVRNPGAALPDATLIAAGVLTGLANGAKLTYGVYAVGLCAAILWRGPIRRAVHLRAWREAFVFGVAVLAGTAVAAGPWMCALWSQFRNPIFPYGNIWIKSPWWGIRGDGPPLRAAYVRRMAGVSVHAGRAEDVLRHRDRLHRRAADGALRAGAAAGAAWSSVARLSGRRDEPSPTGNAEVWRVVALFFVVSFLIWTAQHSILRYLIPLLILSGALIVMLLRHVLRPGFAPTAIVIVTIALVASTKVNDWGRIEFGPQWFEVDMTTPDPDALVLLTSQEPMSYVAPFFPSDARFLGINNSISDAKRKTLMEETIRRTIREHRGPIYSLAYPEGRGHRRAARARPAADHRDLHADRDQPADEPDRDVPGGPRFRSPAPG